MIAGFTACQDNKRSDGESEHIMGDTEREAEIAEENRLNRERMEWESNTIAAVMRDNSELQNFSRSMDTAQIAQTFSQEEGPYTIFAPSDDAYEEMPEEERNQMMSSENRDMNRASLQYLVIDDEMTAEELMTEIENADGTYTLTTMQGEEITATMDGENVVLRDAAGNTAVITETDLEASNGVIHIIDGVLHPKDPSQNAAAQMNMKMDTNREMDTVNKNTMNDHMDRSNR